MPWITIPGIEGRFYEPDRKRGRKRKHNCPDCFSCRWCSDATCATCLRRCAHKAAKKKAAAKRKK